MNLPTDRRLLIEAAFADRALLTDAAARPAIQEAVFRRWPS